MSVLLDVKKYIQKQKRCSWPELCTHFKADKSILPMILNRLKKHGYINQCSAKTNCGIKCSACVLSQSVFFEYNLSP